MLVLMAFVVVPAFGASGTIEFGSSKLTTNSIWNIKVTVKVTSTEPQPTYVKILGLGTPFIMYQSDWSGAQNSTYLSVGESDGTQRVYRVAVSRGLNLSNKNHQCSKQRLQDGEDASTVPPDLGNPLLLRDPFGNGMWYARALKPGGAIVTLVIGVPGQPDIRQDVTVTVVPSMPTYSSNPAGDPNDPSDDVVDWGTPWDAATDGADRLECYNGQSWPSQFSGPDPITPVAPSPVVQVNPTTPDNGASSTTFDFRVRYYNSSDLPPSPWLWDDYLWMDEFSQYATPTGVVLYLDYMNIFDPLDELYPFPELRNRGYKPHFMKPEDGGTPTSFAGGVNYLYRLQPTGRWGVLTGTAGVFPPTPQWTNEYMSLLMGNYHYYFSCSDDHLYFWDKEQLFFYNGLGKDLWGFDFGQRSGTPIDPSTPIQGDPSNVAWTGDNVPIPEGYSRYLVDDNGNPFMAHKAGRTYSTWGDEFSEPRDWQLWVDRVNKVPGRFEPTDGLYAHYPFPYPYPSTEHPEVTIALEGFGHAKDTGIDGFVGTLKPYRRAVNPCVSTPWDPTGFRNWSLRMESSGATLGTTLNFRIKYYQRDNKPPREIRLLINNKPVKLIDSTKQLNPENGDFVSYSMKPAQYTNDGRYQAPPYNYESGVEYLVSLSGREIGAGPHTYFFLANDGVATAIFPARPDDWVYGTFDLNDWDVPGYYPGSDLSVLSGMDNNYVPGPYVNNPVVLSDATVNPTTGTPGQKFVFRINYKDIDGPSELISGDANTKITSATDPQGQRPYRASVYLDTGTTADYGYGPGIIKADMVKEDPRDIDYTDGCWYVFDSASLDAATMAHGVRRHKFEFVDDWGRQSDPNDRIEGEITKFPATGIWIEGPTATNNPKPRLRDGKVESTDGTTNSATLWKFGVNYFSLRDVAPNYVSVYVGEIQEDGKSIKWDSGHDMVKANPSDKTYSDGCQYIFQTQLKGYGTVAAPASVEVQSATLSALGVNALDQTLANGKPAYASGRAIVHLKTPPAGTDAVTYRNQALNALGVTLIRPLKLANSYLVKVGTGKTVADVVNASRNIAVVKNATPDYLAYEQAEPNDTHWDKLWSLRMINADKVWEFEKGQPSVIVAVLDSGVSPTHPDLQGRLLPGWDAADGDDDPSPGLSGHGTQVAGIIAAQGNNGLGVVGVCWDGVKILPVKVEPDDSEGMPTSAIIDGLEYAKTQGAHVVNMSIGGAVGSPELREKLHELSLAGIILVAAAGNDGIAQVSFPAAFDDCIAVAAVNQKENLAFYSNYGPEIDIAAPGGEDIDVVDNSDSQIWSTRWANGVDDYAAIQGTSIATPHVAGAAALLLSTGMSAQEVKDKMLWGARVPKSGNLVPVAYGHGILDVERALTATEPQGPDTDTYDPGTYVYSFVATDGANMATYVPADEPNIEKRSESAGCMMQDPLIPTDPLLPQVYHSSKFPIVGTLAKEPVRTGALIDPIVYRWPKGDEANAEIVSRIDDYVCTGNYYLPTVVYRVDEVDPAFQPSISGVLGVYLNEDLSGTNYFLAEDGTPGGYQPGYDYSLGIYDVIILQRELPYGAGRVYIKYRHGDAYEGDYTLDRWTGTFSFVRVQDPEDVFLTDYFFTSRSLMDSAGQGTIGPIGLNTAPTLTSPGLTPLTGDSEDEFIYTVTYKDTDGPNGQAPFYVRVIIDGFPYDMNAINQGTPSYRAGVTYEYKTKDLTSGSHNYYFEASDGYTMVVADSNVATAAIEPIKGPWVNDPPILENGLLEPDVLGAISVYDSVTYKVTYKDPDNDAPYAGTPKVFVDNSAETEKTGTVESLIPDPIDMGKYRGIRVASGNFTAGQFAGKLMQITSGVLNGRIYLISNNTTNTLSIMTDDLSADGLAVGSTFTVGSVKMFKLDASQQNYVAGVTYSVTVPQLGLGSHQFHFKAASTLTSPDWLTPAPVMSEWVRYPLSGEQFGPTVSVESDPQNPNHEPVLHGVNPIVEPTLGSAAGPFQFNVKYSDVDGDSPGYHNRLLGYIRVVFNNGAFSADMLPANNGSYITGRMFTVSASNLSLPAGTYTFHFEASDGRIESSVRWPELLPGESTTSVNDPEITIQGSSGGNTTAGDRRVVATIDKNEPDISTPVIDMLSSPIIPGDGSAVTMWGATRVGLMRINIWDPAAQMYRTYGAAGFPTMLPGMAMWIQPQSSYPAEGIDQSDPPTPVSTGDVLDFSKLYRLLKPTGDLYSQNADCAIDLVAGWNMIGSPYQQSTSLASATVTRLGVTKTFAQASASGSDKWIAGYVWMWDAAAGAANPANGYKLVQPGTARTTIDPWRGHWIKVYKDCTLVLSAP